MASQQAQGGPSGFQPVTKIWSVGLEWREGEMCSIMRNAKSKVEVYVCLFDRESLLPNILRAFLNVRICLDTSTHRNNVRSPGYTMRLSVTDLLPGGQHCVLETLPRKRELLILSFRDKTNNYNVVPDCRLAVAFFLVLGLL